MPRCARSKMAAALPAGLTTLTLLTLLAPFVAGCVQRSEREAPPVEPAADLGPLDAEEGVRDIMEAKLIHTSSLLRGIANGDAIAIEHHAEALAWLSTRAEFRVHESVAYTALNDRFRAITASLAERARARDLDAVSAGYLDLMQSCMRCHEYLRAEGLVRELPGAVSRARVP